MIFTINPISINTQDTKIYNANYYRSNYNSCQGSTAINAFELTSSKPSYAKIIIKAIVLIPEVFSMVRLKVLTHLFRFYAINYLLSLSISVKLQYTLHIVTIPIGS